MTEQELKEKIVKIIKQNGVYNGKSMHRDYYVVNDEELADALIAAGIGDVKEEKFESDHYWRMWQGSLVELERAEHRAARAERALNCLARSFAEAMCKYGDDTHYLVDGFIRDAYRQAEKELAEERKDD